MTDIFISYSKHDQAEAGLLAAFLEAEGYKVWWDRNLLSGDNFRKEIMKALSKARAVITIWSKDSVQSEWVMSESGRGLADGKLIPVKQAGLDYKDIPPPFDNQHTENIGNREQILAAVQGQLAKPAAKPHFWKQARYEFLVWFGILGSAITIISSLDAVIKLANWARWLVKYWTDYIVLFWQKLFSWISLEFPIQFMPLANILLFLVVGAIGARLASNERAIVSTRGYNKRLFIAVPVYIFLVVGGLMTLVEITQMTGGSLEELSNNHASYAVIILFIIIQLIILFPLSFAISKLQNIKLFNLRNYLYLNFLSAFLIFAIVFITLSGMEKVVQLNKVMLPNEKNSLMGAEMVFVAYPVLFFLPLLIAPMTALVRRYFYTTVIILTILGLSELSKLGLDISLPPPPL